MSKIETYTSTGKNVSLNCFVRQSNPKVERFNFYKGNQIIFNHERYDVSFNLAIPMATLTVIIVLKFFFNDKCLKIIH